MAFGMTFSPIYLWLKFSHRILLTDLQNHPSAKICALSSDKHEEYINAIGNNYKNLCRLRVWGAADGLKIQLQGTRDWATQRQFFNMVGLAKTTSIVFLCSHLMVKSVSLFSIVLILGMTVPLQSMGYTKE